jgi:hypothetical protein
VRPQGAPVGMTVAADGALWLVEDKNATVIRIDTAPGLQTEELPCGARTDKQIDQLVTFVRANDKNRQRLRQMRTHLAIRTSTSVRSNPKTSATMPFCGSRCRRTAGFIRATRTRGGCGRGFAASGRKR